MPTQAWILNNKDRIAANRRAYYAAHQEHIIKRATAWAQANKADRAAYQKQYRASHREEFHKYQHAHYVKHKPEINAKNRVLSRTYYQLNKERLKEAARHDKLQRKFGLTKEAYEDLLRSQDYACAICHGVNASGRRLAVDHDHATGRNRGLLCSPCNVHVLTVIERYEDRIASAMEYLRKHKHLSIKE